MKEIPLDPVEWDFRAIREAELPYAIRHEYRRSCPLIVNHASSSDAVSLQPWVCTRREIPWNLPGAFHAIPLEDVDRYVESLRQEDARSPHPSVPPISREEWFHDAAHGRLLGDDLSVFVMGLNPTKNIKTVLRDFERWLRWEMKHDPRAKKPKGKAAAPRWAELKWLAAFRLVRIAKMSAGPETTEMVQAYARTHPVSGYNNDAVLPSFTSWEKALAAAEAKLCRIQFEWLREQARSFQKSQPH